MPLQVAGPLDRSSPLSCLRSLGLLDTSFGTGEDSLFGDSAHCFEHYDMLEARHGAAKLLAESWTTLGGVDILQAARGFVFTCAQQRGSLALSLANVAGSPATYRLSEGPDEVYAQQTSPLVVCGIRACGLAGRDQAVAMISTNQATRLADVMIYDPFWNGSPESTALVANAGHHIKEWMKQALGPGWGVRVETLTAYEVPAAISLALFSPGHCRRLARFWIFAVCLLKAYMPFATADEIIGGLVREMGAPGMPGTVKTVELVIKNIRRLVVCGSHPALRPSKKDV